MKNPRRTRKKAADAAWWPAAPVRAMVMYVIGASLAAAAPGLRVKVTAAGSPPATAAHQPVLALPATGPVTAVLSAEPAGFTPGTFVWTQVGPDEVRLQHLHAAAASATMSSNEGAQVTVSFPERGIYQFRVTASEGGLSASAPVWIHVWDRASGLNPLKRIGRNPGNVGSGVTVRPGDDGGNGRFLRIRIVIP